jgi:hypothetical protein
MTDQQYSSAQNYQIPMNSPPEYSSSVPVNSPLSRVEYKTPCNCITGVIVVSFFIMGFGIFGFLLTLYISDNSSAPPFYILLIPLLFGIISIILGSCSSMNFIIEIDNSVGTIFIRSKKIFFCFNKSNVININEVRQVVVKIDPTTNYEINGVHYNAFEVIFQLVNGQDIKGCSGVIDKNGEGRRAASIIRSGIPRNIPFAGDLVY